MEYGDISLITSKAGINLVNYLHLTFKSVNCFSRPLKQLSKVSFWSRSQEYLFRKNVF